MEMTKLLDKVANNAETEFSNYKKNMLENSKEDIFLSNYEIHFYVELHEYLISENLLNTTELAVIAEEGTEFIKNLFDFYLYRDYGSIDSWNNIFDLIKDYVGV